MVYGINLACVFFQDVKKTKLQDFDISEIIIYVLSSMYMLFSIA